MQQNNLNEKTKKFALEIVSLVQLKNETEPAEAKILANSQLLRSGTAVAANYYAACRGKSRKDFIHKMGTVVEEQMKPSSG